MPVFVGRLGIAVDHGRQRSRRLVPAGTPESISKRSKEQRSSFTRDSRESQKNSGQDATVGRWHDNAGDGLPFARPKGHGPLAQIVRHGSQEFLGAAQRNRNHHQSQRESASERGE